MHNIHNIQVNPWRNLYIYVCVCVLFWIKYLEKIGIYMFFLVTQDIVVVLFLLIFLFFY